jgi:hypothetical protein
MYRIPASYHQYITNEFRRHWAYGRAKPSEAQLQYIIKEVYSKYPIPAGSKELK